MGQFLDLKGTDREHRLEFVSKTEIEEIHPITSVQNYLNVTLSDKRFRLVNDDVRSAATPAIGGNVNASMVVIRSDAA